MLRALAVRVSRVQRAFCAASARAVASAAGDAPPSTFAAAAARSARRRRRKRSPTLGALPPPRLVQSGRRVSWTTLPATLPLARELHGGTHASARGAEASATCGLCVLRPRLCAQRGQLVRAVLQAANGSHVHAIGVQLSSGGERGLAVGNRCSGSGECCQCLCVRSRPVTRCKARCCKALAKILRAGICKCRRACARQRRLELRHTKGASKPRRHRICHRLGTPCALWGRSRHKRAHTGSRRRVDRAVAARSGRARAPRVRERRRVAASPRLRRVYPTVSEAPPRRTTATTFNVLCEGNDQGSCGPAKSGGAQTALSTVRTLCTQARIDTHTCLPHSLRVRSRLCSRVRAWLHSLTSTMRKWALPLLMRSMASLTCANGIGSTMGRMPFLPANWRHSIMVARPPTLLPANWS